MGNLSYKIFQIWDLVSLTCSFMYVYISDSIWRLDQFQIQLFSKVFHG